MGKLLEAFARDELRVDALTERRSPERQRLIEQGGRLRAELAQMLDSPQQALLERLLDTVDGDSCLYAQDRFIQGYRLGVLMTMEVFCEQDEEGLYPPQ